MQIVDSKKIIMNTCNSCIYIKKIYVSSLPIGEFRQSCGQE